MAIPAQRDLVAARAAITSWLAAQRPSAKEVWVGELAAPGGTGFSNETLLFDAGWTEAGRAETERLVLRVQPSVYRVFMESDFESQYRVIDALGRSGQVKVAPMRAFEADPSVLGAPFFVMGWVPGEAPADVPPYNEAGFLVDMAPAQRQELWLSAIEQLTAVHRVDWRAAGFGFLDKPERGPSGLAQQIRYYEEALEWAAEGRPQPVVEAATAWVATHAPADAPTELSWGDARIGNMLFHQGRCQAVLDWEMVSLGGREMDLGWWLFLDRFHAEGSGVPRLPGLGTREDTIAEWQSRTGQRATNLEFYEIFAGLRFAVVMIRIARMAEEWGMPSGDMETNNPVTHLLAGLLDVPPPPPLVPPTV